MLKRILFFCGLCIPTWMLAQQLTFTPLTGAVWSEAVNKIGYMQIRQDSLFLMDKAGLEIGKSALADIHKMEITESPTALSEVKTDILPTCVRVYNIQGMPVATDWKALPTGVYLLQQGTKIYKVEKQ